MILCIWFSSIADFFFFGRIAVGCSAYKLCTLLLVASMGESPATSKIIHLLKLNWLAADVFLQFEPYRWLSIFMYLSKLCC